MMHGIRLAQRDRSSDMARQMGQWVDQVLGPGVRQYWSNAPWTPALNIYEDPGGYTVVVDLAGVDPGRIDLKTEQGYLVLCGTRDRPAPKKTEGGCRIHLMEIDDGHFTRRLRLPDDVDVEGIEAAYRCGLLWVRLPRE